MKKQLLQEGPVGHMWHPFDLDYVKNGKDLLSVFENQVLEYINQFTPSIKIDGINGPVRLVTNEAGEKEFAIDRLSTSPLDVRGVTADRLKERFEKAVLQALDTDEEITLPLHKLVAMGLNLSDLEVGKTLNIIHRKKTKKVVVKQITSGHGFVNDGGVALRVCNAALEAEPAAMQSILERLDMWDNPNICLNSDIVHESSKGSGMVNAVKYDEDFIAFHGLNEIFVPDGKKSRNTREIRLTDDMKEALTDLVNLINRHNPVEGFRALSPYDTVALKGDIEINYSPVLSETVEIKLDDENSVTKSIGQWLSDPKILKPEYGTKYTFVDGKKRDVFSKDNYVALVPDSGEEQYSVRDILSTEAHPEITEDDYYKFASGAVFYHATRLLGRQVLSALVNKSKVGNEELTAHEGIVMRSKAIFGVDNPVKITGDFIRSGMSGGIKQAMVKESTELDDTPPQEIGDEEEEQVTVNTEGVKTVAIMPGSFKPPHMGHLKMAEHLSKMADEVLIFVSAPGEKSKRLLPFSGGEISYEKAMELWKILLSNAPNNIMLVDSNDPSPSPITALGDLSLPADERENYQDVEFFPEDYNRFYLAMSEKEKDDPGSMARFEMYKDNPKFDIILVPAFNHSPEYAEEINQLAIQNKDTIMGLQADIETKALELASGLISSRMRSKLPANPTVNDYIGALSKANRKKVAKFMKSNPNNLDKQNYSATDLRLLLDLKKVYNLPVDKLIADFVGSQNVESYLRAVYGSGEIKESATVIQDLIRAIISEQLEEMSTAVGLHGAPAGGSKPSNTENDEDEERKDEALAPYSELPIQSGGSSTITVTVIPHSRTRTSGGVSDSGFKKAVKNKFSIDSTYTDKRAPYYAQGDVITDLVEKVIRNIVRTN